MDVLSLQDLITKIYIHFEIDRIADIISFSNVFRLLLVTRNIVQSSLFLSESIKGIGFPFDEGTVAIILEVFSSNSCLTTFSNFGLKSSIFPTNDVQGNVLFETVYGSVLE